MLVSSSIYLYLAVIYICIFICSLGMAATCYYLMRMVSGDHKDGVFQQRMMRGRVGSQGCNSMDTFSSQNLPSGT